MSCIFFALMKQYGNHASDDCQQYQITSYDFVCNEIPLSFLIRLMIKKSRKVVGRSLPGRE